MKQYNEKEHQEKSLDLVKRIVDAIKPEDLLDKNEQKKCEVCGCTNDINAGICKKCSNLLF